MISNAEHIKESVDIKQVLKSEGFTVDARGKCACPVHQGKDKNFSIKNGIGTCWSACGGKSWDAIGLLMELRKFTYPEALEEMARIGRINVEYVGGNRSEIIETAKAQRDHKTVLFDIIKDVANYYFEANYKGVALNGMGWDWNPFKVDCDGRLYQFNTLKKFGVSYTGEKMIIQRILADKGWKVETLLELGILRKGDNGIWDTFKNRIVFPIVDERGNVCAFGGRKLKSDTRVESPKYINSPESAIYNKSETLYGLFQNKRDIKDAGFAFLTEGYTDVLTMWENGIRNVVAGCGTALTFRQAKLLARYTDKVVMLYDGDDAGIAAARKSTEILLSAGLHVEVVIMKEDDPDSFLRKYSVGAFHALIETQKQDALIWQVMEDYSETDVFRKEKATYLAADLLVVIESKTKREEYINVITKKTKISKKILADLVKEKDGEKLDKSKNNLTSEQNRDIQNYGLYVQDNQYFVSSDIGMTGWAISNFVVRPIMLIIGADKSWRLVEVKNQYGRSFIADIESDAFVEITAFKKEIERRGNYLYFGKPEMFTRIKSKIYAETQECFPVGTLGWHSAGFWTWGNGISVDGQFKGINEYGIVEHNDNKYFLPAFAKVKTGSDDEENHYEDEKEMIYVTGKSINFNEWTRHMTEVHGANGMMGVAYFCASLFRDIIYNKFNYFPHLNLFGPPGAGKSFMAWSIQAMYGKPKTPFHLVQGTNVGFFRRLAKVRNGISWFDEYSNDVPFQRIEALKAAYDGVGHEKGDRDNANNVTRTKVKSACIISGQQQPTQDVALFKRCISLNFPRFEKSDERDTKGRALRDIEQTHRLSQLTGMINKFRPNVEEHFARTFDEVRNEVSPLLRGNKTVEDRILNNHLIPLSIYKVLSAHLEFSFSYDTFRDFIINNIIEQSAAISNQDEMSVWWKMFQYLVETNLLKHNEDFIVQKCETLTTLQKGGKGTENRKFPEEKTVMFVRFEKAHALYLEYHKRQYTKNGLPESSLKYYLRGADAFLGEVKAKKFDKHTKYCWAFDMEELGVNLPLSIHAQDDYTEATVTEAEVQPLPEKPIGREHAPKEIDEDLPF
jgi:DNA primase